MAQMRVNRITNAVVYGNGANWLGKVEEATWPDMKWLFSEHKVLGMQGKIELPTGMDKLEAKLKWNSYHPDVAAVSADPFKAVQLQLRGNVETWEGGSRVAEQPLVIFLTGTFKNAMSPTSFKQHDNVESESMFNVTAYKQMYNGKVMIEYDAMSNTYKVEGRDVFANFHANTGG